LGFGLVVSCATGAWEVEAPEGVLGGRLLPSAAVSGDALAVVDDERAPDSALPNAPLSTVTDSATTDAGDDDPAAESARSADSPALAHEVRSENTAASAVGRTGMRNDITEEWPGQVRADNVCVSGG
jgi:hypothetical protein